MLWILTTIWYFYANVAFPSALIISGYLLFVSTFNINSGLHQMYIKAMLKVFEFCRKTIESKERRSRLNSLRKRQGESSSDEETELERCRSEKRLMSLFSADDDSEEMHEFEMSDIYDFVRKGVQAVVDDEVTKRFSAEELQIWNLMTRTYKPYFNIHKTGSIKLYILWFAGFIIRFGILFPIRIVIFVIGMLYLMLTMSLIGLMPDGAVKRWMYSTFSVIAFRLLARSLSTIITYHNPQYKPKCGSVCVANHTSPIDVLMLHCDNAYALVGQLHGGYLGLMEKVLGRATSHCFFERTELHDRQAVTKKMMEHVTDPNKLSILIFPEGTCINNSAVMMFKKGSFEVADVVYPVAIKYNPIFGDPFWDSSKYGYFTYLLMMKTSWAIVCDVWYMPPMSRLEGESSIDFASRVKAAIARQGGLVDLEWDGQLKRQKVKPEMKAKVQSKYSRKISVPNFATLTAQANLN